jgi:hypothetical protein
MKLRLAGTGNRLNIDVHFFVNPLYENTPKWHGFLMIKLVAFQASGGADTCFLLTPDT